MHCMLQQSVTCDLKCMTQLNHNTRSVIGLLSLQIDWEVLCVICLELQ